MKITKRAGFFETNSSSTHAICLSNKKNRTTDGFTAFGDDHIIITPGEFGWGPSEHYDADTKASYCYTYAINHDKDKIDMLTEVLKKSTGKDIIYEKSDDEYHLDGYIDHQSTHVCEIAFESKENLENFIFCPTSLLVIDNDNR